MWWKLQVAEGGQGAYESSKVRMEIAPPFWSAIYTIPTCLTLQTWITDHCAKVSHKKLLIYQEVQKNRSNEGQLPALKKAAVSVNGEA